MNKKSELNPIHSPNHISYEERGKCILFSLILIAYGTFGYLIDDIYVPGKRGRGMHFHGISCTVMYMAFLFGAINLISVVVDHYDKRNNETNYQRFAHMTRIIGLILFFTAIVCTIFQIIVS